MSEAHVSVAPNRRGFVMGPLDWTLLLLLGFLWGGTFNLIQLALRELPPFTLTALRMAITTVTLAAVAATLGHRIGQPWPIWRSFAAMGFLNTFLPHSLNAWGQTQITSGLAAILTASTPLFTVVFAHLFLRDERMTVGKIVGVLIGMAGVAVIIGFQALRSLDGALLGKLALVVAAMSMAMAGVFGRRLRDVPPMLSAMGQSAWSLLFLTPLSLLHDQPWTLPMPGTPTWVALAGIALLGTALGYSIYYRLLATVGATNILLVTFLNPITALIMGALFLHESIEPRHLVGMALIGLGLAAIDGRLFRRRSP